MAAALGLARRNLGLTAPNPSVGCVIVRDDQVIGRGWTAPGGRPHAETLALDAAGPSARGATAYVTLEPCCHHGRTPPCTSAIIAAGIARVVIACEDPDPRVAGGGITALKQAGLAVETGLLEDQAVAVNAGFFLRVGSARPLVTLKLATSLDGRIATHTGDSRWITGQAARARGHLLRATHDAVMIGTGTALADDPKLDCRLPGMADRSPLRVILDRRLRIDPASTLIQSARVLPTLLLTQAGHPADRVAAYEAAGVAVIDCPTDAADRLDLGVVLRLLGDRGLTRLLVEGGGELAAALLRADLVDRLAWFRTPVVVGGDGLPALAGFGLEQIRLAPRFRLLSREFFGDDVLETFRSER